MILICDNLKSKGTATVEFVLAIPLLALVIAGTFFFGWVMRNHQRLRVADRYAAWRSVEDGLPSGNEIDAEFFAGRGEGTSLEDDSGPDGTLEDFIVSAREESDAAGDLAENFVTADRVPRGRGVTVKSRFATNVEFWRKMAADAMDSRHVREGPDWRHGQVNVGGAMRDLYFDDLEQAVDDIAGENISQALRNLYQNGW
ncbi:MAG: pilus assembly protein [Phycisphaerae bacterium]|nr:pilus assembly protein [Phycisphaerae bacterium]